LEKAESLYRFAQGQGSPLSTFKLILTAQEGLELVEYLVEQNEPNEMLELDAAEAKRTGDPFVILSNFQLLGMEILPSSEFLH
jgi:hypothetical protein